MNQESDAIPREPLDARYTLGRAGLRVAGELSSDDEGSFDYHLRKLLDSGEPELTLDLSEVRYVSSGYVRHVAVAMIDASKRGIKFKVLAGPRTARLLRLGGIDKLGTIEEVGASAGPDEN